MAHGITETDGAVYALKPAWHGLGVVLDHAPNSAEALAAAGLGWTVRKAPLFRADGTESDTAVETVREDNGAILGSVSPDYGLVQNVDAFASLDGMLPDGVLKYESAFSMFGGRQVCIVARMAGELRIVDGDSIRPYLMLRTSHDGSTGLAIRPTSVRPVCANTVALALSQRSGGLAFTLRHTSGVGDRLAAVVDVIRKAGEAFAVHAEAARAMVRVRLTDATFDDFLADVMPLPEPMTADNRENPAFGRAIAARRKVAGLFREGPANNLPGIAGTAWAAFNAVTEYVDHVAEYRGDAESAYRSKSEGAGAKVKAAAWSAALALAK